MTFSWVTVLFPTHLMSMVKFSSTVPVLATTTVNVTVWPMVAEQVELEQLEIETDVTARFGALITVTVTVADRVGTPVPVPVTVMV